MSGAILNSNKFKGVSAKGQIVKGLVKNGVVFFRQYDTATQAVIDACNSKGYTLPSNLIPLDNFIRKLKSISSGAFWNSRDGIFLSAIIGNSSTHNGLRKINIKSPTGQERDFYGGISLNTYGGLQGNSANAYIDYVTAINAYTNYKQNDAGIIVAKSVSGTGSISFTNANNSVVVSGLSNGRINTTASSGVMTDGYCTVGLSRTSSTSSRIYKNNTETALTSTSSILPSTAFNEFRTTGGANYWGGDSLITIFGASFTASEMSLFNQYFNEYLVESGFSAIA
ncbi:hypothetical protein J2X97_000345 [Epilithonimonas hungarica]|uniref:hypothetical protein n=1 Tax=Epilithonimonas hungarica TaxID=454006 RepID=UPI00277E9A48|nr:hypothetical protein [Epilithonimonas hungarica]MDP9954708.1 hypothetical protein [Epilithonimonas hungarica]